MSGSDKKSNLRITKSSVRRSSLMPTSGICNATLCFWKTNASWTVPGRRDGIWG